MLTCATGASRFSGKRSVRKLHSLSYATDDFLTLILLPARRGKRFAQGMQAGIQVFMEPGFNVFNRRGNSVDERCGLIKTESEKNDE